MDQVLAIATHNTWSRTPPWSSSASLNTFLSSTRASALIPISFRSGCHENQNSSAKISGNWKVMNLIFARRACWRESHSQDERLEFQPSHSSDQVLPPSRGYVFYPQSHSLYPLDSCDKCAAINLPHHTQTQIFSKNAKPFKQLLSFLILTQLNTTYVLGLFEKRAITQSSITTDSLQLQPNHL